ncbi:MAG TPA: anaerobic glycerol-3-phosphate dehydrogenase subunit GlpA [Actinomycetota bacterium]|nr:anaerobic glycerol-3-phosphate dehydrogenase subunit GlpA [Actinomycetota bacterium]
MVDDHVGIVDPAISGAMSSLQTDVLVIGGGSTGLGVVRDAAMRGFQTILVERGDLATGTTGRFHGLLHSGGRYVVKDPKAAEECIHENGILRRIAADCIQDTGGLFVTTPIDDPEYADRFAAACREVEVPCEEVPVAEALRREPRLNPGISRAFQVPDASVDSWKTVWAHARSAEAYGATILPYHEVLDLAVEDGVVKGALLRNHLGGEEIRVHAEIVVNASGAWAGKIAGMAGCEVTVFPGKGIMVAMNHLLAHSVVNRCSMPSDGDIIVPAHTVSVIGTTDVKVEDPDRWEITPEEVQKMLDAGENLVPGFRQSRALRVWGGVRPLYQDKAAGADTRDVTRAHALLNHRTRDGVERFVTITGGKFCTLRLMAEETVDAVCAELGAERPCRTADEPLPGSEDARYHWLGERVAKREETLLSDQLICECEFIQRRDLEAAMVSRDTTHLDDIRRTLRLGMGPCQGGFCIYRATGILHQVQGIPASVANRSLLDFLQERWKGVHPILYGDQLRQARLDDWIFQGLLDVNHLPGDAVESPAATGAPT